MIEIRRAPKDKGKPAPQRYTGARRIVLDWQAVKGASGQILWACQVDDADRAIAQEFVDSDLGAKCEATLVEVEIASPLARPLHEGVKLVDLQNFYNSVPVQDRLAYLAGKRPAGGLPVWAEKMPAKVREELKHRDWPKRWAPDGVEFLHEISDDLYETLAECGWPAHWTVKTYSAPSPAPAPRNAPEKVDTPARKPDPAPVASVVEDEHLDAEPELDSGDATDADPNLYGTAEQISDAVIVIKALLAESPDPSTQKIAHRLRKNNLPAAGDHMEDLLRLAKE